MVALGKRTTARAAARRGIVSVRHTVPGPVPAGLVGGVLAGSLAALVVGRIARRGWLRAAAWLVAAGLAATAVAVMRTRQMELDRPDAADDLAEIEAPARTEAPPSPDGGDVVDVLLAQRRRIDAYFAALESAETRRRTEMFAGLADLLHKHEHAEQSVVHRRLRDTGEDAARTVDDRVAEETEATRALADLIQLGVDDPRFDSRLRALHEAVRAHAANEETIEFPELRRRFDAEQRRSMANQVLLAQTEH
jgi:hemerythrin superfamily protein